MACTIATAALFLWEHNHHKTISSKVKKLLFALLQNIGEVRKERKKLFSRNHKYMVTYTTMLLLINGGVVVLFPYLFF